jgi:clan AA aspartic protease (TIGR02281 family)
MTESEIPNGLVPNQKIKSLNSISFHNGKLIKMSYSGLVSKNEFSSFPYYSKVFLKVLNSVKYRKLSENTIYLTNEQNMKFLTASINGSDYKFLLDTGASSVVINKMVLSQLIENGYLTRNNYVGKSIAEIADGSIVECEDWKIPEIKIGNNIIKDITVSVINSEDSMLLFGMDGLNKLNVKKLNLKENEITLNRE